MNEPPSAPSALTPTFQEDLRPFVMAIAQRHPDLDNLSPDEVSLYVETVLAVTFYKHRFDNAAHSYDSIMLKKNARKKGGKNKNSVG